MAFFSPSKKGLNSAIVFPEKNQANQKISNFIVGKLSGKMFCDDVD